jgi:aminopeptidase-like protein
LGGGPFHVSIETAFKDSRDSGEINYGEAVITGSSSREIIFSTYICHPSMANNELSGPTLAASIMKYLLSMDNFYTYRFLFFPETIGAIAYISDNLVKLKSRTVAGWVLTCLGDPGKFSHVTSRYANNFADRLTREVFSSLKIPYNEYSWLERGSDERQYCSPGVDLPFCTLTRSKFGTFKEYHTSLDNLSFVTPGALRESYEVLIKLIEAVETKRLPDSIYLCEPQMSKRSLYPPISQTKTYGGETRHLMNVLSYCDGQNTIEEITEKTNLAYAEVNYFLNILLDNQLIKF